MVATSTLVGCERTIRHTNSLPLLFILFLVYFLVDHLLNISLSTNYCHCALSTQVKEYNKAKLPPSDIQRIIDSYTWMFLKNPKVYLPFETYNISLSSLSIFFPTQLSYIPHLTQLLEDEKNRPSTSPCDTKERLKTMVTLHKLKVPQ
jgi:hypothetical protein